MKDKLLTISQVAKYLQVTRVQVYNLAKRAIDPLPIIRTVGSRSPRISSDMLKAWVAGVFDKEFKEIEIIERIEDGEEELEKESNVKGGE
jgi:excisionase family DNA binding protein